ncbi:aminotransferase class IV [Streptomyces sp. B6B3]|uniref:aminotransferase class IV n=1 Tax=Streptomyces sp. B6B3 TaxID=3153570 RepID=UPI00325C5168
MSDEQNGTAWADGSLREWRSLSVPLMSDAVVRAAAVFDGMRADLTGDGRVRLLSGRAHARRLLRHARSLRIAVAYDEEEILRAASVVARAEFDATGRTLAYVRPMALGARLTDEAGPCSLTIAAFAQETADHDATVRVQVSALRRPGPDSLPPQVKSVANYQLSRLARLGARAAGFDDALFLNPEGRLAEAAGAAVLVERDGRVFTPPSWEGCLPSITVDVMERIAAEVGIPFSRAPIPLPDVTAADGVALAGTLADLVDVSCLDDADIPPGPTIATLRRHFRSALSGSELSPLLEFSEFSSR